MSPRPRTGRPPPGGHPPLSRTCHGHGHSTSEGRLHMKTCENNCGTQFLKGVSYTRWDHHIGRAEVKKGAEPLEARDFCSERCLRDFLIRRDRKERSKGA